MNELKSGIVITAISKYAGVFVTIIIGAILARLLSPEEFGTVAVVTVFISFFNIIADIGIGPAIIQNKDLTKYDIRILYGFSFILALVLALTFSLFSKFLVFFYDDSVYFDIGNLLAVAIFFSSCNIIPLSTLRKSKRFKLIGIFTVVSSIISGSVAIVLAYNSFSYYAIVIQAIVNSMLLFTFCSYKAKILPVFSLKIKPLLKIAKFSSYQFLFNFINYFSRNLDNILIGKYMGQSQLGYYEKSYKLMMMPIQNLTHVITPVLHPILSDYQKDNDYIYNVYLKVVRVLSLIGFPLSIFLFFGAKEIILFMFGNQWVDSIPVFKVLALSVGIQMLLSSTGAIFQSINRTDLLFLSGGISAILMVSAIVFGIFIGGNIVDVGYALLIAFIINFFQGYYFLIHYGLRKSLRKFLSNISNIIIPLLLLLSVYILFNFFLKELEKKFYVPIVFLCIKMLPLLLLFLTNNIRKELSLIFK
nr:lipopolysaccharide biosynthesis protein [uncultured Carboxylicivirga sp.]